MTLELSAPVKNIEGHRNFRDVDWDVFRKMLAEQLCAIPGPCDILTNTQFQMAVKDLTQALQATIEAVIPAPWPAPHSCCWWNKDLSQLKKEMNCLSSQSYWYRAINDHPSHAAHQESR